MVEKELLEQKIGEAIGLEIAAQKSVKELMSKGLLKAEHEKKTNIYERGSKQTTTRNGRTDQGNYRRRRV
jgi:predicted transcriptional regulator